MAHKKKAEAKPSEQNDGHDGTTRVGGQSVERKRSIQEQAFYLSVEGKTCREIAEILGINKTTASKYIREEEKARADELADRRETEKARRVARLQHLSKLAENAAFVPGTGALGACGKFEEMINKIMGVDAPTKIDVGLRDILQAFNDISSDDASTTTGADTGV